jgi:hypothetical protein
MSDAIAQAQTIYAKHGLSLSQDLSDYLRFGYVFSEPGVLLLGRPIVAANGTQWLPESQSGDAWYVHLAVGQGALAWFVQKMPFYLPLLGWRRDFKNPANGLRFHPTARVATLTKA